MAAILYHPEHRYSNILTTFTTILMHICRILAFPKEQKKWHTLDLVIFNLKKDSEYSLVLSNLLTEFPLGPIKGGKL